MHNTVAFRRTSGAAVEDLTIMTPLADPNIHIEGNFLFIGEHNTLAGILVLGAQVDDAQLDTPSLRRQTLYDLNPIDAAAEPTDPSKLIDLSAAPLQLVTGEGIRAFTDNNAAAAVDSFIILLLASGALQPVKGDIITLRCTSATTLVANAWSNCVLTLSQTLPVGRYAIVGASFSSTGCIAGRIVPVGQTGRPGGVGCDTFNHIGPINQRGGGWGVWCEFESSTPPSVDILSVSADTAEVIWLDLIKLS